MNRKIKIAKGTNHVIDTLVRIFLVAVIVLVASSVWAEYKPDDQMVEFHDFAKLQKENPDVVAWLKIKGTRIDYPVLQGKDNFEYLAIDMDRKFYEGGSLFLDSKNKRDFSDSYSVIYGHNMAGPKMFGELKHYYKETWFQKHKEGLLTTPSGNYHLRVMGVVNANAYGNNGLFTPGTVSDTLISYASDHASVKDDLDFTGKVLALSTCSSTMDDNRDVVLCEMTKTDEQYVSDSVPSKETIRKVSLVMEVAKKIVPYLCMLVVGLWVIGKIKRKGEM